MKQEIIIRVQMNCDKCRTKAMEVAASAHGVESVSLAGEEKNSLVVVGDGVDSVNLARTLRKKVGYTDIIKVGEIKKNGKKDSEKKDKEKEKDKEKDKEKEKEKDKEKGKEKEKEKDKEKDGKKKGNNAQKYQRNEPMMEYVYQWYPSYPAPPQVLMYENPNYSNPNCSIM